MQVDLKVVQLLCSRLCHDLIGPTGAVHNGLELFEEMGIDGGEDALKMVSTSISQLSARLGFFRMAFGVGGLSGRKAPLSEARQLTKEFLSGGRIDLDWAANQAAEQIWQPSGKIIKLLFNMILVAVDALPRGGTLNVSLVRVDDRPDGPAIGMAIKAAGEGANLKVGLKSTLLWANAESGEAELDAHNIHGFFCYKLAQELASQIEISAVEHEVRLAVLVQE
jgi:histidine phosphotransferase ChpT